MKAITVRSFGLALSLWAGNASAQEVLWRPAPALPKAVLGYPLPGPKERAPIIIRAQSAEPPPPIPPITGPYGPPASSPFPQGVPPCPPGQLSGPPLPPPPGELYNNAVVPDGPRGGGFWDKCKDLFHFRSGGWNGGRQGWLRSDHGFDNMISPVSNPFGFEDPRALTQLRPIFIYQSIPNKNHLFKGGDVEFFGVHASVALTERWSVVMSKLGGVWFNPKDDTIPGYEGGSGLAELQIGPKWTFIRNEQSGTVGALGVNFDLPIGARRVFQDTGSLSVVPYFTLGQSFGRSSYGSFNAIGSLGYSLAVDDKRTDHFFTSVHLDYDIANLHKIYPLVEVNWVHFTNNGGARPIGFEGRDLVNFGATPVSGNDNLSLAAGVRYKFNEHFQFGTAVEFPLNGRKDLMDFRVTVDFIIRY